MHYFRNPDGTEWYFGPSTHLRTWSRDFGKAHDVWVAENGRCFHSPGLGDCFREDSLESALKGVKWLFVISYATSYEVFIDQLSRAHTIEGTPWSLASANCQQTVSWVTTGKASSFQLEALFGVALVVAAPAIYKAMTRVLGIKN